MIQNTSSFERNVFINCPTAKNQPITGAHTIWRDFNIFHIYFIEQCEKMGYDNVDIEQMPITEYIYFAKEWIGETTDSI
jgi:hypothetical protein